MAFAFRILFYIVGGGALLAAVDLQPGPIRWVAIPLYIVAAAYVDMLLERAARGPQHQRHRDGVVKLDAYRTSKRQAGGRNAGKPERRTPRPLFDTTQQNEAEGLVSLLRSKGLTPIMVTRRTAGAEPQVVFEVRLPEQELPRAKSLMSQYIARKSAPLN
jgi:hypothetical protein